MMDVLDLRMPSEGEEGENAEEGERGYVVDEIGVEFAVGQICAGSNGHAAAVINAVGNAEKQGFLLEGNPVDLALQIGAPIMEDGVEDGENVADPPQDGVVLKTPPVTPELGLNEALKTQFILPDTPKIK